MFRVIIILGLSLSITNGTSAFVAVVDGILGGYNHSRLSVRRSTTSIHNNNNHNDIDIDDLHKTDPSTPTPKPSIAIIGSGAVGCYYGSRLWETQRFDVRFYMRGEHLEVCRQKGLRVDSIDGDIFLPPEEMVRIGYGTVEDIGTVDWVLLCLKSTALGVGGGDQKQQQRRSDSEETKGEGKSVTGGSNKIRSLLLPLLHKQTRIISVMNGMVDDDLIRLLEDDDKHDQDDGVGTTTTPNLTKCAATYAGMAFICSNRISPGHVVHSYAGGLSVGLVASSSSLNNSNNTDNDMNEAVVQEHQDAVIDLFRTVRGFSLTYEPNVVRARWSKMLWNLPFNGISVAMGGITIDRVVQDPGLREMAYTVMDETLSIANADLVSRGFLGNEYCLGRVDQERMMYLSDHMGEYSTSTMLDLVNRRPMEVYYLFEKALERADELGIPVPVLRTLMVLIKAHQSRFNLF